MPSTTSVATGKTAALGSVACSALDTLLALLAHQRICRQCAFDERFCETAQRYEKNFMSEVRRYERAQAGLS